MSLVGRHGYYNRPEQFLASDPAPKTPYRYLPMCCSLAFATEVIE
jgi:hypothetical protein